MEAEGQMLSPVVWARTNLLAAFPQIRWIPRRHHRTLATRVRHGWGWAMAMVGLRLESWRRNGTSHLPEQFSFSQPWSFLTQLLLLRCDTLLGTQRPLGYKTGYGGHGNLNWTYP